MAPLTRLVPAAVPPEILAVCRRLREAGHQAYLVGGAVRDHLLGRPHAKDFDIATSARPEAVIQLFGRRRTVPTGIEHGTVTVLVDRKGGAIRGHRDHVEVTTFRGEGAYSDGRRPDQVAFHDDLTEDLRRRDFTINAIAYDPIADRLLDPFGGQADLRAGLIRAVGAPAARFGEDGLRPMRAVRFAAQLEFRLDPTTQAAIPSALPTFRKVSWERIRDELLKLLGARRPSLGLALMRDTGLLDEVLPELRGQDVAPLLRRVDALPPDPILRLCALVAPVPAGRREEIPARLKLSARDRDRLLAVLSAPPIDYTPDWSDAQVRRFLARTPPQLREDLFALALARQRSEGGESLEALRQRAQAELARQPPLSIGQLAIGGQELMQILNVPPGPLIGEVLRRLLDRVLDDPSSNTRERLAALARDIAQGER
jgi:tRNA nucleotidyltransferase (CCA-adding enzyme)